MPQKKTNEEFLAEIKLVNPNLQVLGEYVNANTKIEVKCTICGHKWNPLSNDLLRGHGCPKCSKKRGASSRKINYVDFTERVNKKSPMIEILGEYVNNRTGILCRCKICNHTWKPNPGRLMSGQGCPECNKQSTSFIEQVIFETLKRVFPKDEIVSRDRKTIGAELDIYVPDKNLAIEYGAYYWHRDKINWDRQKETKCRDKGIRLIRIYDRADEGFSDSDNCLIYTRDLSQKSEYIYEMLVDLLELIGIRYGRLEKEYNEIREIAYVNSRKKTTEEFVVELKAVNPNTDVLGEYKNNHERIKVKCKVCGHEWNPTPHGLLAGCGCRKCYEKRSTLTTDAFVQKMKERNPNIEVLGMYKKTTDPILCRCKNCGHEWEPIAKTVLKYGSCPECAKNRERTVCFGHKKKTQEEFLDEVIKNNPTVEVLGKYKGTHKPVLCRCKVCGREWTPEAFNVAAGHGCRKCAGRRHSEWMKEHQIRPKTKLKNGGCL